MTREQIQAELVEDMLENIRRADAQGQRSVVQLANVCSQAARHMLAAGDGHGRFSIGDATRFAAALIHLGRELEIESPAQQKGADN